MSNRLNEFPLHPNLPPSIGISCVLLWKLLQGVYTQCIRTCMYITDVAHSVREGVQLPEGGCWWRATHNNSHIIRDTLSLSLSLSPLQRQRRRRRREPRNWTQRSPLSPPPPPTPSMTNGSTRGEKHVRSTLCGRLELRIGS